MIVFSIGVHACFKLVMKSHDLDNAGAIAFTDGALVFRQSRPATRVSLSTDNFQSSLVDRSDDNCKGYRQDSRSKHINFEGRNCRDDNGAAPETSGIVV